jgi:hypothetical protein
MTIDAGHEIISTNNLDTLLTIPQLREVLGKTEPLSEISLPQRGDTAPKFNLSPAWAAGIDTVGDDELVDATISFNRKEYRMTKAAALQATSSIGLTQAYVKKTPANLIEPHLNYWFSNRDGESKLLVQDGTNVLSLIKGNLSPFSNLRLVDVALDGIEAVYGKEARESVLCDYKFAHDLTATRMRLVVPAEMRAVREGDNWMAGVQLKNSLTAASPTALNGYLFRFWCTNGSISSAAASGNWSRRHGQGDEVYEWARSAVDEILGGMEHEFEAIQALTTISIDGEVNHAIDDVFQQYRVPLQARQGIIDALVESNDLTMYGLMQAITQSANGADVPESIRERVMAVGGDLPHAATHRCDSCHRLAVD